MHYEPPFTITNKMLMLVAQIAEKTGRISNYRAFESKPHFGATTASARSIPRSPLKQTRYRWMR